VNNIRGISDAVRSFMIFGGKLVGKAFVVLEVNH